MPAIETGSVIKAKSLDSFHGTFVVKDYQRGYRWDKAQVRRLLDDIWLSVQKKIKYFLQPMVVRKIEPMPNLVAYDPRPPKSEDWWEVIDGQQRLTTLYLAISFADRLVREQEKSIYQSSLNFRLAYETRIKSSMFLSKLGYSFNENENIDYFYMNQALNCIDEWFMQFGIFSRDEAMKFQIEIIKCATVLWYDPGTTSGSSEEIFSRLNMGKIPLTNAELLRAWFLSEDIALNAEDQNPRIRQLEIGMQWDEIEHELTDPAFWYFITNKPIDKYDTKIDLLMEMAAKRFGNRQTSVATISQLETDSYDTFYVLSGVDDQSKTSKDALALWHKIYRDYQLLQHWYRDRDLYHKIGYLITAKVPMESLLTEAQDIGDESFRKYIDDCIRETLCESPPLESLRYDKDKTAIFNHLLLFNILSVLGKEEHPNSYLFPPERYPFAIHKQKINLWSIEHVHAQQNIGLNTKEQWQEWIKVHMQVFECMDVEQFFEASSGNDEDKEWKDKIQKNFGNIVKSFAKYADKKKLDNITNVDFESLSSSVAIFFEQIGQIEEIHSLDNLALLSQANNSALSNSIFEVKRQKILELDKRGEFIPLCTKRLFMRYYDDRKELRNRQFWSKEDRESYVKAIRETLDKFLTNEEKILNHVRN